MAQEGSSMEMGTSDQVLVAAKKSKKLAYVVGFIAMVAAIAVVITLVVVFSQNVGGAVTTTTSQGPTTVTTPSTPSPSESTPGTSSTTSSSTSTTTTTPAPPLPVPPQEIDLEDFLNGDFSPLSFNGVWTSGNEILFRNSDNNLVKYDVNEDSTLLIVANTSQYLTNSYRFNELSSDGRYIALSYNENQVYRHSFTSQYVVIDTVSREEYQITPPGVAEANATLQNFVWAPTGSGFAFVFDNNVYYQSALTSEPQMVTVSGQSNVIYNGIPDWVYEEEVFSSNSALWFSNNGNMLAYATFDDTNVRVMKIPTFGVPGSVDYQYTTHRDIRYPKSGTRNPTVSVTIRSLPDRVETTFFAPALTEPILKSVTFVNENTIAVMWTDRVQTQFIVNLCTQGAVTCQTIFSYTEANGWIDNIPLIFNQQGNSFITILPFTVNNVAYKQVVQVSQGATAAAQWTLTCRSNTAHTVIEILKWTSDNVIWYEATLPRDSSEQHIYSVNSNGVVSCFTCDLVRPDGGLCLYNDAVVNEDATKLVVDCTGPNVPQVFIYNTNGTLLRTWEDNSQISQRFNASTLPVSFLEKVPLGGDLRDAYVHIQAPRDYLSRTNVPLLIYVYAGPDTAHATKQWSIDWGTSLVSREKIAVARIDGRGSGLQGVDYMFAVNRRLGTLEIEDQITVTKYLQQRLPWIDSNRTCIWGWSYGGYAASLALARGGDVFKCAIAVAPVVDWRFYDTIYTERYMDTPQANPQGYLQSSLLTDSVVEAYRNKSYLLVHGTEDDNVHYQHAMLFSRLLQKRDVYFTQMSYTDEDHGLGGVREHLYHGLEKFLKENMF